MDLRERFPNIGKGDIPYVHCPHCSKMYPTRDEQERTLPIPPECLRCECPMIDEKAAIAFMEALAVVEHKPSIAALGAATRAAHVLVAPEEARGVTAVSA